MPCCACSPPVAGCQPARGRQLGPVLVFGPGTLVKPRAKQAEPAHQRPGHGIPLARQHDIARHPADHQGQPEQQQPPRASQVARCACTASSRTAATISSSVTVTMPATWLSMCRSGSAPTCSTRSASAIVRWVSSAGQATRRRARSESRASAASSGSAPMTTAAGHSARMAAAMPEIRPPPLTGTTTRPTAGQSAAISRPTVPWPAMTARPSKGGMSV